MVNWINNNFTEIIGAALALIYLILEIKQKWFFWVIGIISSAFYVFIFYKAGLFAEMGLNIYYIFMSIYGLYCWKFTLSEANNSIQVERIKNVTIYLLLIISILTFGLLLFILKQFNNSQAPLADALIATLSIIATWMVAKKIIECWYIWIFVNFFAICLYIHQKLYPTAILFIVYTILSVVGLLEWRKTIKKNDSFNSKF